MYRKPSLSTMYYKRSLITMYRQISWFTILFSIYHKSSLTFCSYHRSKNAISDKTTQFFYKYLVSPAVDPILTFMCNCYFATSTFTTYWNKALINPLLKTPTPLSIADTRAVAILPEQSKLVEREALELDNLEANELLDPQKVTAVTEDIIHAIEKSKVVILFNFSTAFDSISYRRLLQTY